jgi:cobalt-zinc-cadmium resistance protein CzcA
MKQVPGNQDVYTVENDGVQYLRVAVDRLAAGRLRPHGRGRAGRAARADRGAARRHGDRRQPAHPIVLRGPDGVRLSPAEFAAMRITTPTA